MFLKKQKNMFYSFRRQECFHKASICAGQKDEHKVVDSLVLQEYRDLKSKLNLVLSYALIVSQTCIVQLFIKQRSSISP